MVRKTNTDEYEGAMFQTEFVDVSKRYSYQFLAIAVGAEIAVHFLDPITVVHGLALGFALLWFDYWSGWSRRRVISERRKWGELDDAE